MESAERTELRAYIGINSISLDALNLLVAKYEKLPITPGNEWPDLIAVGVTNYGKTPGKNITTHINWVSTQWPQNLPNDFDYPDVQSEIDPNIEVVNSSFYLDTSQSKTLTVPIQDVTDFRRARDREIWLFIYGHIDYADIYGRRWRRHFCVHYQPWTSGDREKFPSYGYRNYEEELA